MPRDRQKELERKRLRYATDPVFRERVLEHVRKQAEKRKERGIKRVHKTRPEIIDIKRRQCECCGDMFVSQHERDLICCGDR